MPLLPPSNFLGLPLKIRLEIYKLLLVSKISPDDIQALRWRIHKKLRDCNPISQHFDYRPLNPSNIHPSILATCRCINQEATCYLYDSNTFFLATLDAVRRWLHDIGPSNAEMLKDLTINEFPFLDLEAIEYIFQRATSLNGLHIVPPYEDKKPIYVQLCVQRLLARLKPSFDAHKTLNWAFIYDFANTYTTEKSRCISFLARSEDAKDPLSEQCYVIDSNPKAKKAVRGQKSSNVWKRVVWKP
ncbi:MAG: hypothetical protein Q9172_006887 [Xanthocarpia lactea]